MMVNNPKLCKINGCRRVEGHKGSHSKTPSEAWQFLSDKGKKKINKTGYATLRGGDKGAYQNHVMRHNKVIIPYEKLSEVNLDAFEDGYIIRLFPRQFFEAKGQIKSKFFNEEKFIEIGKNAFILYRTHDTYENFPPLANWSIRKLIKNGKEVRSRGKLVEDIGHYVLRISAHGKEKKIFQGPPQGIFAPEYCQHETNYLAQCMLAWLIVHTVGSPHTSLQAAHLEAILKDENLLNHSQFEGRDIIRNGFTICPLCLDYLNYDDLHGHVSFDEFSNQENAAEQVKGSVRSTVINLFHLTPLNYKTLDHNAEQVAWGHAVCNTKLGQRKCYSLSEIQADNLKVGIIKPEGITTFGWISPDFEMIRTPRGMVWVRLTRDLTEEQWNSSNND